MSSCTSVHPEIKRRLAMMCASIKPVTKSILKKPSVDPEVKAVYAGAYLFSRSLYNAGTWPDLTVSEHRSFNSGVMKVYRAMLPVRQSRSMTDQAVIARLHLLSPMCLLRYFRIVFFVRCVSKPHGPTLVAVYLARNHKRSWVKAVMSDLKFIATFSDNFHACLGWSMAEWVSRILEAPQLFLKKAKLALRSTECSANSWPSGSLVSASVCCIADSNSCVPIFVCSFCSHEFKTKQQCNLHMTKKHNWLHPAHCLVAGVTCPICLQNFDTRARLLEHLMYKAPVCYANLLLTGPVISFEVALQLREQSACVERKNVRAGHRRAKAHVPVVRALGPRLPCLPLPPASP
eukprot:4540177-Karenia_brevis.AAC.1